MARVVLVTGVSRYLGGRLARLLGQHPDVERRGPVDFARSAHVRVRQQRERHQRSFHRDALITPRAYATS